MSPSALTETFLPSERTPHSSEVSIGSADAVPVACRRSCPHRPRSQPLQPQDFLHGAPDHVLVGEAGQLEAASAGVDHARLLVADEEGGVGRRVVVVEQLEDEAEAALRAALGARAEAGRAVGAQLPVPAVRADEKRHSPDRLCSRTGSALPREPHPEVLVGPLGEDAAARSPLQQALLEQVGLQHVLDRVLLLADRHRQRREADRPAGELGRDRVAAGRGRCGRGRRRRPRASPGRRRPPRRRSTRAPSPGRSRGPASAGGWRRAVCPASARRSCRRPPLSISTSRIPAERPMISRQVLGAVVLEAVADAEAVAQRRRQQAGPRRRPDQREGRQRQRHRAGAGALAEHDRKLAVLHRRVEGLLHRPPRAGGSRR